MTETAPVWKSSCSRKKQRRKGWKSWRKRNFWHWNPPFRKVVCALHAPTGGIVCPFKLTIALAENAAVNGVEFHLNEGVKRVRPEQWKAIPWRPGEGTYEAGSW